jgi:hypothetical protein|tara:strand:+ start:78 stop:251 length:174 start_codon:yes stop_codon:yes gene_type:complete
MEPGEIADEVYFLFMGFLSPSERKKFIIDNPDDEGTINTDKGSDLFYDLEDYFKNLD